MAAAEGDRRRGIRRRLGRAVVGTGSAGEIEAGEEGLERRVAVDEGCEEVGPIFDDRTEGEDEEGEEEEGEEVAGKRRRRLSQDLGGAAQVVQPWMLIAHRGFFRKKTFLFFFCFSRRFLFLFLLLV